MIIYLILLIVFMLGILGITTVAYKMERYKWEPWGIFCVVLFLAGHLIALLCVIGMLWNL